MHEVSAHICKPQICAHYKQHKPVWIGVVRGTLAVSRVRDALALAIYHSWKLKMNRIMDAQPTHILQIGTGTQIPLPFKFKHKGIPHCQNETQLAHNLAGTSTKPSRQVKNSLLLTSVVKHGWRHFKSCKRNKPSFNSVIKQTPKINCCFTQQSRLCSC